MKFIKILRQILKEDEEHTIDSKSDMEKILQRSKKVTETLIKLLTDQTSVTDKAKEQLRNVVTDIKAISMKPTTFRIVLKNGNFFSLKYDPSPLQLKYPEKFETGDSFTVIVSGKRYEIGNRAEFEQALDYINKLMATKPVAQAKPEEEAVPDEEPGGEEQPDDAEEDAPEEEES